MDSLWIVFYCVFGFGVVTSIIAIIYSGLYDLRAVQKKHTPSFTPSVTIIVPAYNEEVVIERALQSIIELDYPALSVIVVNDASKDSTATLVRTFLKTHKLQTSHIRFINLQRNRGKGGALNAALKKVTSELTMILDADCVISSESLSTVASHFNDPQITGVAMHVRLKGTWRLLDIVQRIEFIIGHRHKKYYSAANAEFTVSGQGSTYRTQTLRSVGGFHEGMMTEDIDVALRVAGKGNKAHVITYASDALLTTEPVPTLRDLYKQRYRWKIGTLQALYKHQHLLFNQDTGFTKSLTILRLPQAILGETLLLLEPLFVSLFIYTALSQNTIYVFLGIWLTQAVYNILVIMMDEQEPLKERLMLASLSPLLVPFFYSVTLMNVALVIKCLYEWDVVTGKVALRGGWTPPTRPGAL